MTKNEEMRKILSELWEDGSLSSESTNNTKHEDKEIAELEARLASKVCVNRADCMPSYQRHMDSQDKRIAELEREVHNLNVHIDNTEDTIKDYEKRIADLKSQLAKKDEGMSEGEIRGVIERKLKAIVNLPHTEHELWLDGVVSALSNRVPKMSRNILIEIVDASRAVLDKASNLPADVCVRLANATQEIADAILNTKE